MEFMLKLFYKWVKSLYFLFLIWFLLEVNYRDYRAWYGLGQTYEILKMPFYCLYYYRQAHKFRYFTFHVWLQFSKECVFQELKHKLFAGQMTQEC